MQQLFNLNGVQVYLTGTAPCADPAFQGIALRAWGGGYRVYEWTATPNQNGFCIEAIELPSQRRLPTIYETATRNLGLEISAYINRNA